jgi:heme A synthase
VVQVTLGTQVREHIDVALAGGVARPDALGTVGSYDRWHRDVALLVTSGTMAVCWLVVTRYGGETALSRTAGAMAALVAVQVALGATMAYLALTPPAQVAHLTGSSVLLGVQTVLFLLARWLPQPNREIA